MRGKDGGLDGRHGAAFPGEGRGPYSCLVALSSSLFFWNMFCQCPVSSEVSSSSLCSPRTKADIFCFSASNATWS